MFVRINEETHYFCRAVVYEGEALEIYATKRCDGKAALKFLKRAMKRYGRPGTIVTDRLQSYDAVMKAIGIVERRSVDAGSTIGRKTHTSRFDEEKARWRNSGTSRP